MLCKFDEDLITLNHFTANKTHQLRSVYYSSKIFATNTLHWLISLRIYRKWFQKQHKTKLTVEDIRAKRYSQMRLHTSINFQFLFLCTTYVQYFLLIYDQSRDVIITVIRKYSRGSFGIRRNIGCSVIFGNFTVQKFFIFPILI